MATAKSESHKAVEINVETGEVVEREMTAKEVKDLQASQTQMQAEQDAKTTARASALAKLADLGLTAEEIAAL
jgi:DNA-binding NarL/FixJ family response regulator